MFTRRTSDEEWVKYLLNTGLLSVDQYQTMRGGSNQVDITEIISKNAHMFDNDNWINHALQQDRFHYIPKTDVNMLELETIKKLYPLLMAQCIQDQILPLSYQAQVLYLGLLRYDQDFPELQAILKTIPLDILVCLVPLGPAEFAALYPQIRSLSQR